MLLRPLVAGPAMALCLLVMTAAGCSGGPVAATGHDAGYTPPTQAELAAGVVPCRISSGYAGDSQCIEAPEPSKGFQFHYGPSSYSDANEVAKYLLMPGQENTDCVFFPTPNTTEVYFNEYHSRLRPGSHHLLLYVQPVTGSPRTSTGPEACKQGAQTRNLFGATSATMDVKQIDPAPENRGLAVRIPPTQQGVVQLHVINTGSTPILREAWANIVYTDPSTVTELADPIFFLAGLGMSIQVGQTIVNKGTATVPQNAGKNFRLIAAIPHTHAHTPRFTAYKTIGGKKEVLLEQFGVLDVPNEPYLVYFDSVVQNPQPNEAAHIDGAYTGTVYLSPGDTIDWECEQTNDGRGANGTTFSTPLQFTEQAYTGEMCNLFGIYAPSLGGPWQATAF